MNNKIVYAGFAALLLGSSIAFSATGSVTIMSPADGSSASSKETIKLNYEADVGTEGDHLHLNVDGKRVDVIHQLKGTADVGPLAPGKHQVCLAVNTKSHVPTGVEKCISVTSK